MYAQRGMSRIEFGLVAAIFAVLIGTFLNTVRTQQEQAEKLMVELSIMAMRTSLMAEVAQRLIEGHSDETRDVLHSNPVRLLKGPPGGYLGEFKEVDPERIVPGSWYFDLTAGELVYRPKISSHFKRLDDPRKEEIRWQIKPTDTRSRNNLTVDALSLSVTVNFEWF